MQKARFMIFGSGCPCGDVHAELGELCAGGSDVRNWHARLALHAQTITRNPDFESAAMLLIAGNCITLAMYNPLAGEDDSLNTILNNIEIGFNALFTLEMLIRIASYGNFREYIAVPWNLFDAIMVIAGYTQFLPTGGTSSSTSGIRALRAMRALRPLRTIMRFSSLRSIVVCFIEAVPLLMSVIALLFFMLFLFAIAGMQLFQDSYHRSCVNTSTGQLEPSQSGQHDTYGCGWRKCPEGFQCQTLDTVTDRNEVSINFDNIASAASIPLSPHSASWTATDEGYCTWRCIQHNIR
jgi:Ion transport protein